MALPLACLPASGNLMHLEPVYPPLVREEEDVAVHGGHKEPFHEILFPGFHADLPLAAALLGAVDRKGVALDVACM